jgi:hypothetical protein
MSTSYLFKSTDAGAPVLTSTAGSLIDVLDACLVSGYGSKAPLGWTKPFSDAPAKIGVYRNNPTVGSGCFVRVHDNNLEGSTNKYSLRMFASMTDAYVGIDAMPADDVNNNYKSIYNVTLPDGIPWMLIGDNRGFYLITDPYYPSATVVEHRDLVFVVYVGDYVSLMPKYKKGYCLIANNHANAVNNFGYTIESLLTATQWTHKHAMINKHPYTMDFGAIPTKIVTGLGVHDTQSTAGIGSFASAFPTINDVPYLIDTALAAASPNMLIGKLPGLYVPSFKGSASNHPTAALKKWYTYNGCTYVQMSLNYNSAASISLSNNPTIIIKIGDGFRV